MAAYSCSQGLKNRSRGSDPHFISIPTYIDQLDQIRLLLEQVVSVDVNDGGFDIVFIVFEQKVITALNELGFDVVGCIDDIAIGDGEVFDGVFAFGESECICTLATFESVFAHTAKESVITNAT